MSSSHDDSVYDEAAYSDDGVPDDHEHDRRNFLPIGTITREAIIRCCGVYMQ
jgi:hypothetical protein